MFTTKTSDHEASDSFTPVPNEPEWIWVYATDNCENCGGLVRRPNALKVHPTVSLRENLEAHLKFRKHLPFEEFYSEEKGHCVCENCEIP